MNEKVGIVTFNTANNYGAVLQCYALSEVLKAFELDISIVYRPLEKKSLNFRSKIRSYVMGYSFKAFNKEYLPSLCADKDTLDSIVFGSDQIWNLDITGAYWKYFFGHDISSDINKVSYAASIGTSKWTHPNNTAEVRVLLSDFKAISVRETSGQLICKDNFSLNVDQVLDPTLLLNSYVNISGMDTSTKNIVLYSFIKDATVISELRKIAVDLELQPVILNDFRFRNGIKSVPFPSVERWLNYLKNSSFVITDSFHGMVFSIIFRKQFVSFPALPERAGRMTSLLKQLGLEDRFFDNICDVHKSRVFTNKIDFVEVHSKISKLRSESLIFLKSSLNIG